MNEAIEPLTGADLPEAEALLRSSDLPTEDLARTRPLLLGVRVGAALAGLVGLEAYAGVGLLRSLVVRPEWRGTGLGARLTEAAEAAAREHGIGDLYLLTSTAERFFGRRGYAVVDRAAAPEPIRRTAEFANLCPASCTFMHKRIDTGAGR